MNVGSRPAMTRLLVVILFLCSFTLTVYGNQPPVIKAVNSEVTVDTGAVAGAVVTQLDAVDSDGPYRPFFYIADPLTNDVIRLEEVAGSPKSVRLTLKMDLSKEKVPSNKTLKISVTDGLAHATVEISLRIVRNSFQQALGPLMTLIQNLCKRYSTQSPRSEAMSRFRLLCILYKTVYSPDFLPDEPSSQNQPPVFQLGQYKFRIPENTPGGTQIGRLTAVDPDVQDQLTFSVYDQATNNIITLGQSTASQSSRSAVDIYLKSPLDREKVSTYTLYVVVSDGKASATAMVILIVDDVNDNAPKFSADTFHFNLSTDTVVGKPVMTITATDPDLGPGGMFVYTLVAVDRLPLGLFSIDSASGVVTLLASLQSLAGITAFFDVLAQDTGGHSSSARVYVLITNASITENTAPEFVKGNITVNVREEEDVGTSVTRLEATDTDGPGPISFYLQKTRDSDLFSLLPGESGDSNRRVVSLLTRRILDRESISRINLIVIASDGNRLGTATVVVNLLDVNDNAPVFSSSIYQLKLKDDVPIGTIVDELHARDMDSGDNGQITFSLQSATGLAVLPVTVNETSGVIKTNSTLRKLAGTLEAIVIATDKGTPPLSSSATLVIEILTTAPVNQAPRFLSSIVSKKISESFPVGMSVAKFQAMDPDGPRPMSFSFVLSDPIDEGVFHIQRISAESIDIILSRALDREAKSSYRITVAVTDGQHNVTAALFVSVLDENDNIPQFSQQKYSAQLGSDTPVGTTILQVVATDEDLGANGYVTYSLKSNNPDILRLFRINATTGVLVTEAILTSSSSSSYTFQVIAQDNGTVLMTSRAPVTINITADIQRTLSFNHVEYKLEVVEEKPIGTYIGSIIVVNYDSRYPLVVDQVYSDSSDVILNPVVNLSTPSVDPKGMVVDIITAVRLDRESKLKYSFSLRAKNGQSMVFAPVVITVMDINDNTPTFTAPVHTLTLPTFTPVGFRVAVISATDPDEGENGRVRYKIQTNDQAILQAFTINETTGDITVVGSLQGFSGRFTRFRVLAKDGGLRQLSSTTVVEVEVPSIFQNKLSFHQTAYNFQITEDLSIGSLVGTVIVTGEDTKESLVLDLVDEASGSVETYRYFRFNTPRETTSGLAFDIITTYVVDHERRSSYSYIIRAVNGQKSASVGVTIDVMDINDNKPIFLSPRYSTEVPEAAPVGIRIVTVSATDRDSKENGQIRYSLQTDNQAISQTFSVNETTGDIRTRASLRRFVGKLTEFSVLATDSGSPPKSSTTLVEVDVLSEPQVIPFSFEENPYTLTVRENMPSGTIAGRLTVKGQSASSVTFDLLDTIIGSLVTGRDFQLQQRTNDVTTVDIETTRQLDYETRSSFSYIVRAVNGQNTATARVFINVLDVNDNNPVFVSPKFTLEIPETTPVGLRIGRVTAKDLDSGINGEINYSIKANDTTILQTFWINKASGDIETTGSLQSFVGKFVQFTVVAKDAGTPRRFATSEVEIDVFSTQTNSAPSFGTLPSLSVLENSQLGTVLGFVSAVDSDGPNQIAFSLDEATSCVVSLRNATGDSKQGRVAQLRLDTLLDREITNKLDLKIMASDGKTETTATVTLSVLDVNDNHPRFSSSNFVATINKNATPGSLVVTVNASDLDQGENQRVTYSIQSVYPPSGQVFLIDENTGAISTKTVLTSLNVNRITLLVAAKDHGAPALSAVTTVVINLESSASTGTHIPRFRSREISVRIEEGTPLNSLVWDINIQDDDGPQDITLRTVAEGANDILGLEQVRGSRNTGWKCGIFLKSQVDREAGPVFRKMLIVASDGEAEATATVTVYIIDVNDNYPVFDDGPYTANVSNTDPAGTNILTVTATDRDSSPRFGNIYYYLEFDDQSVRPLVKIDSRTGQIKTASSLVSRVDPLVFKVVARDGGGLSTKTDVVILVNT